MSDNAQRSDEELLRQIASSPASLEAFYRHLEGVTSLPARRCRTHNSLLRGFGAISAPTRGRRLTSGLILMTAGITKGQIDGILERENEVIGRDVWEAGHRPLFLRPLPRPKSVIGDPSPEQRCTDVVMLEDNRPRTFVT